MDNHLDLILGLPEVTEARIYNARRWNLPKD